MIGLTKAQTFLLSLFQSAAGEFKAYKSPHAPQPTPPRPHRSRKQWEQQKFSARFGTRPPVFGGRA